MGLFSSSSPQDLDDQIAEALSPAFYPKYVGNRTHKSGLNKLAGEQSGLLAALTAGERLQNLVPCFGIDGYDGLAVLTQNRVFQFKRSIRREMALDNIAEVDAGLHPSGCVVVDIKGLSYIPYSDRLNKSALDLYHRNYLQFSITGVETGKHFVALLNGIRKDPRAAI